MKVLIVSSKNSGKLSAFVTEQATTLQNLGVEIDYYSIIGKGLIGYLKNITAYINKINEFKPDLIHAHYGLSGALAVLQSNIPVVITFHDGETHSKGVNFISSLASMRAVFNIYVAQHIYDQCIFKRKSNYTILPCGVDSKNIIITEKLTAANEMGLPTDKKYILFGGAFSDLRKNYPLLKESIALLNRNDINVIEMRGLNRAQITKLMCGCDVFALPTKREGSPQALKEAMACNCPIIATDVADIKYIMGEIDGTYITSFDPKDVADKITQALEFGKRTNGRQRIIDLGLDDETVAKRIFEIYKTILN